MKRKNRNIADVFSTGDLLITQEKQTFPGNLSINGNIICNTSNALLEVFGDFYLSGYIKGPLSIYVTGDFYASGIDCIRISTGGTIIVDHEFAEKTGPLDPHNSIIFTDTITCMGSIYCKQLCYGNVVVAGNIEADIINVYELHCDGIIKCNNSLSFYYPYQNENEFISIGSSGMKIIPPNNLGINATFNMHRSSY